VLRLLDSCQLTARHTVATPVNWKPGQDVIIPTSVSDEDAKKKYPQGFKTLKPYLRTVAQPKSASFPPRKGARPAPSLAVPETRHGCGDAIFMAIFEP